MFIQNQRLLNSVDFGLVPHAYRVFVKCTHSVVSLSEQAELWVEMRWK